MPKKEETKSILLSNLYYKDADINVELAKKLVVYHYPIKIGYLAKEKRQLETQIDDTIDGRQYAYLFKGNKGNYGVFVALNDEHAQLPVLHNINGERLLPDRVIYQPSMNPVWVRLIMRLLKGYGMHCKGGYKLGQPLLKLNQWKRGIDAISIDCTTKQLSDNATTQVSFFYNNVPLMALAEDEAYSTRKVPLWVYSKNNVFARYYPSKDNPANAPVYFEIKKRSGMRKQRAYIDLRSAEEFKQCRMMIFKNIQTELIQCAKGYGFTLIPQTLTLKKNTTQTKHKLLANGSAFPSLDISGCINVIDLRINQNILTETLLDRFSKLLEKKNTKVQWALQKNINSANLNSYQPDLWARTLILIDQEKGIEGDLYPLTTELAKRAVIQHINVNPYGVYLDPVEQGVLIESKIESKDENDLVSMYLTPDKEYYNYALEQLDNSDYKKSMAMKLDVVLKELLIKRAVQNPEIKLSECFPMQRDSLHEDILVITLGSLFTVENDRPVIIPFGLANSETQERCDIYLKKFGTTTKELISKILANWPYHYCKYRKDLDRGDQSNQNWTFYRNINVVLSINADRSTGIMLQDTSLDKDAPVLLLENTDGIFQQLKQKKKPILLSAWILPDLSVLQSRAQELSERGELKGATFKRFVLDLPNLHKLWQQHLVTLHDQNETHAEYATIKKEVFKQWLMSENKKNDVHIRGAWDTLLSNFFDRPLNDVKRWLSDMPGLKNIWHDPEQGYFIVGNLSSPKDKIMRQPSTRQWHAIQGSLNTQLLVNMLDVDWVRVNQFAGNPCVSLLVKRWKEVM